MQAEKLDVDVSDVHQNIKLPNLKTIPEEYREREEFKTNSIYYTMASLYGLQEHFSEIKRLFSTNIIHTSV